MNTAVRIYDNTFAEVGIVGKWQSLVCKDCFREAGEAKLVLHESRTADLLRPDGYIAAPHGVMYRIVKVERNGAEGTVTAQCEGLLGLMRRTVIPEEYSLEGSADSLMYSLARKSSGNLPLSLTIGDNIGGDAVEITSGRCGLYEDLVSLCHLGDMGMKLENDGGQLKFSAVPVRDRTAESDSPVLASPKIGTFLSERVERDYGSYCNVAVVSGAEKETGGRYAVTVRGDRLDVDYDRQMLVKFTAPVRPFMYENSEGLLELNEDEYLAAMRLAGAAALGRVRPRTLLYGVTTAEDITPGDRVSVYDEYSGLSGTAIAETVVTSYTDDGPTVRCELSGSPDGRISVG